MCNQNKGCIFDPNKQRDMKAIGKLKAKKTVNCTVCCSKLNRSVSVNIYENTEAEKQEASKKLIEKANAPYTCRICKSILAIKKDEQYIS